MNRSIETQKPPRKAARKKEGTIAMPRVNKNFVVRIYRGKDEFVDSKSMTQKQAMAVMSEYRSYGVPAVVVELDKKQLAPKTKQLKLPLIP